MSVIEQNPYLEAKILAAPPHRLHLMLLEGAICHGRKAEEALRRGDAQAAATPLLRLIDIAGELLAGVREQRTDVNKKLAELYWYLFRRVSEAKIHSDAAPLAEALRLLEYERETWTLVCQKLSSEPAAAATAKNAGSGSSSAPGLSLQA